MKKSDRIDRLFDMVAQARRLIELAKPQTSNRLRVLDALTPDEISELGRWRLRNGRTLEIAARLAEVLSVHSRAIRQLIVSSLCDLWDGDELNCAELRGRCETDGEIDVEIETILGQIPQQYSYLCRGSIFQWKPERAEFGLLLIEDDDLAMRCSNFLVAKGWAFGSTLDVMEVSVRERWHGWQSLWQWL